MRDANSDLPKLYCCSIDSDLLIANLDNEIVLFNIESTLLNTITDKFAQ